MSKNAKKLRKFPNWINHRAYHLALESLSNPKKTYSASQALDIVLSNKPKAVANNNTPINKFLGRNTISYFLKRWGWSNDTTTKNTKWWHEKGEEWLMELYLEIFNQTPAEYEVKEVY